MSEGADPGGGHRSTRKWESCGTRPRADRSCTAPSRSHLKGQAAKGSRENGAGLLKGEWEVDGGGSAPFPDSQVFAFQLMTAGRKLPEESAVFSRFPYFPPNRFEASPLPWCSETRTSPHRDCSVKLRLSTERRRPWLRNSTPVWT